MSVIAHCRGRVDEVRTALPGYFHIDCSCSAITFAQMLRIFSAAAACGIIIYSSSSFQAMLFILRHLVRLLLSDVTTFVGAAITQV